MGTDAMNPLLLYAGCGLGAIALAVSMPRKGTSLAIVGALVGAFAVGLVMLGLGLVAGLDALPNLWFYAFSLLALGSGLRMITHPRPVYAALYFVLTIISSAGLYVLLSAEFMAFALIIIYAGAILITYLFVIMLATQAPSEEDADRASEYDASAREPVAASMIGFVLLAVLTTVMFRGTQTLESVETIRSADAVLADLPNKVESALRDDGLMSATERVLREGDEGSGIALDVDERRVTVIDQETEETRSVALPDDLVGTNPEQVGINLLAEHPMTIEVAGVILLMAMLGATVLARKQVDIEEAEKARQVRRLDLDEGAA